MTTRKVIPAPEINSKAYERVFDKMYITNVEKRLRELNSPSENDKKRWVWELIQNAKDTIAKDPNKNSINIRIEISKGENDVDIVRFRHDGSPFTPDARLGLLYKYSEDKENQESTGRFGTGFLTTHCLSKVVTIESNMYSDASCTQICGFTVTMYRDGLIASELIDGLKKMRESEVFYNETFDWTTFTYHVTSESGRQAIKLGLENFRENIAQTMLFCKELASVVLDDNGKITTIERKPTVNLMDGIMLSEFDISFGETHQTRRFIHTSYSGYDKELSKRYRATRNIRLDTAIEVDKENNLVDIEDKTTFFCVLPLVGIESQLNEPLIVNSPDFEPDQERQSLLLSGITWNEEKDVITENGINRSIYEHIFPLYKKIVNYLSNEQYGKLYYLANGLDRTKTHEKLDREWYKQNVINKYREILMQFPVADALDGLGYLTLKDCIIVKEPDREDEEKVYGLLKTIYPSKLIKNNHEWSKYLWEEGLSVWDTEILCKEIEQKANWSHISLSGMGLATWYNAFLSHVSKYNELFLKNYALLPNMNGELLKKDQEDFKQGEHINFFVIGLLESLGKDVKPILLHDEITTVSLDSKYNSQSYSADINRLAKAIIDDNNELHKVTKLLPLISVVPDNAEKYKQRFLNQRKEFFDICKALHQLNDAVSVCDNNLLEGAWKETDEWLVTNILNTLNTLGCLSKLPDGLDAKWLNAAIKSLNVKTEILNTFAVLPNQNGTFCCQKDLFEDAGVPEELKDIIFDTIGINYKNVLLHEDIEATGFAVVQKKTISSFASELNDAVSKTSNRDFGYEFNGSYHKFPKNIIYKVSSYMIRLLPKNKETTLYKQQSSILSVAQAFNITEGVIGHIEFENKTLWDCVSFHIACCIREKIEEFSTLTELCTYVSKGESEVVEILNSYYAYQEYAEINFDSDKVIPNQNGDLLSKNDLYKEEGVISDIIKNIVNKLSMVDDDVQDYRDQLTDKRIELKFDRVLSEKDAYNLVDESIDRLYQIPSKWEDENFINASQMLIEDWGDKHRGLFEESFPRVFPNKEKILMNVVWKKEKRELMMNVSSKLTEDQLKILVDNGCEIGMLSSKIKTIEEEKRKLEEENKKLKEQLMRLENGDLTIVKGDNPALSEIERIGAQIEAQKELMRIYSEWKYPEGFGEGGSYSCFNVVKDDNKIISIVLKSHKTKNPLHINTNEWDWIMGKKDDKFKYCGGDVFQQDYPIAPAKLFIYTGDDIKELDPKYLIENQPLIALSFSTENLDIEDRITAFSDSLHYFKGMNFDFESFNLSSKAKSIRGIYNKNLNEWQNTENNSINDLF